MKIDVLLGLAEGHGGLETAVSLLVRELTRLGHRVRVLQSRRSAYPEWERDLPMYYYDPTCFGYPPRFPEEPEMLRWALGYRRILATGGMPDAILATHTPLFSLITRLAAGSGPKAPPIISWLHGPLEAYGDPWPLRFADAHLAISQGVAESLRKIPGPLAIHYVGNPIDLDVPIVARPERRCEFLFFGRLEAQKNPEVLLRAFGRVAGDWHLTVYGDGSLGDRLQVSAKRLGISGKVTWRGWRTSPWDEVGEASALVLTSDYEGFGLVLAEALARGLPVVATDVVGPSDVVRTGENGWLFAPGDHRALARILRGIVSGETVLPSPDACRASVRDYAPDRVAERVVQAIGYASAYRPRL